MSLKDVNPVNAKRSKRVAIVISSPTVASNTGCLWASGGRNSPIRTTVFESRDMKWEFQHGGREM